MTPLTPREHQALRPLPGAKRLKLSPAGEIRALLRIGEERGYRSLDDLTPRIKEAIMEATIPELIEPTITLHETKAHITLDADTTKALYALAWEKFEQALIQANAAYNSTEWSSPHERAKELLWASQDLKQLSDVLYTLTAAPEDLIED